MAGEFSAGGASAGGAAIDDAAVAAVIAGMDAINDSDPQRVTHEGVEMGASLRYAMRMSACLAELEPEPSIALWLAVRAQHLGRFSLPRSSYPAGRSGYLSWRTEQARRHAALARQLIEGGGLGGALADRVAAIVQKKQRASDHEAQTLEDCACLVFLAHELEGFAFPADAPPRDPDEVALILKKSWAKMSERAQKRALTLALPERCRALIARALDA